MKFEILHSKTTLRTILFFGFLVFTYGMLLTAFLAAWSEYEFAVLWLKLIFYSGTLTSLGIISVVVKEKVKGWLIWLSVVLYFVFNVVTLTAPGGLGFFLIPINIFSIPLVIIPMLKLLKFKDSATQQTKDHIKKVLQDINWTKSIAIVFIVAAVGVYSLFSINASHEREYQRNLNNPENTPEAVYEQARQALLNNDLEGVLETVHYEDKWKYEDDLKDAYSDGNLPELVEQMPTFLEEVISEYGNVVVYGVGEVVDKTAPNPYDRYDNFIEFTRDNKGLWKISTI